MPTVKIHIPSGTMVFEKPILVKEVSKILDEFIKSNRFSEDFGQILLYEALPQHRSMTTRRNNGFIFVEILAETGIGASVKKQLMKSICEIVSQQSGIPMESVNCSIIEYAPENRLSF